MKNRKGKRKRGRQAGRQAGRHRPSVSEEGEERHSPTQPGEVETGTILLEGNLIISIKFYKL